MAYSKTWEQGTVDPNTFGNWILIDEHEFTSETLSYGISGINGDEDNLYRVVCKNINGNEMYMHFNNDTGLNYKRNEIRGTSTNQSYTGTGLLLAYDANSLSEALIYAKSGDERYVITDFTRDQSDGTLVSMNIAQEWTNTLDNITSIQISSSSGANTGKIMIYKWQDITPTELHSYELIKEWTLNNEIFSETIDVIPGDIIFVKSTIDNLFAQINGDTSNSYHSVAIIPDNNDSDKIRAGYSTGVDFMRIDNIAELHLNTGSVYSEATLFDFDGRYGIRITGGYWTNSTTPVTSLNINTRGNAKTGNIKIYRLAQTHLIASNPGELKGMWQKYIDDDTVEVQPGVIEIGGTNCHLTYSDEVSLSGNLRSGETESSNTYYYLYAVKGTGRNISFKFSSIAPTRDRYGNTVSSFEDCDMEQDWYHPNEGITWRYIGQVYNNSSSNISSFDKCKPGYWESRWISFSGGGTSNITHAFGKTKFLGDIIFASSSIPTSIHRRGYEDDGTSERGGRIEQQNDDGHSLFIRLGQDNVYYDGTSWQNSGYYKVILKG